MTASAMVLTFCVCQAQCRGVKAAWLPGPRGQTDGPVPARAGSRLGLRQGHVRIRSLVKDLRVPAEVLIITVSSKIGVVGT